METNDYTGLDWIPVMLIKYTHCSFREIGTGISLKRLYLAQFQDSILQADWTLPADERFYPLVQMVGWNPLRDVPFNLPVRFHYNGSPHLISLIPSGTWVLPYDNKQYDLYVRMQTVLHMIFQQIDTAPLAPETLKLLTRWIM